MLKIIMSGGGTGGHIFPAIAIANQIKQTHPHTQFQFVGATGRMEMEKVPQAGYPITDIPVQGLQRSLSLANFKVLINFIKSYYLAKKIIKSFNPNVVIGTGGYVSLPVLYAAQKLDIPTLIWEGNGHIGLANKILTKRAKKIALGLPGMETQFPAGKAVFTGNPIRTELLQKINAEQAMEQFNLQMHRPTILVTGGSLGARTINQTIETILPKLISSGYNVIWQTGKNFNSNHNNSPNCYISQFINNMHHAYYASNLVISRAGAITLSEICAVGKASILIPSPNVTDDHQTKNALVLQKNNAAILLPDSQCQTQLLQTIQQLLADGAKIQQLQNAAAQLAKPTSTQQIAQLALDLCK